MNRLLITLTFILLFPVIALGQTKEDIDFVQKGVCKVISNSLTGQSSGTGFFYKDIGEDYLVLTNGHVVNGGRNYKLEFYRSGYKTKAIPASITKKVVFQTGTANDVAVLKVSKADLGPLKVNLLPIDYSDSLVKKFFMFGWGYPTGRGLCYWESRVLSNDGHIIEGTYPNIEGQSGGPAVAIIDGDPTVVGMVTWRLRDDTFGEIGGCISSSHVINILKGKNVTNVNVKKPYKLLSETEKCGLCGQIKADHYYLEGNDKDLFCPDQIEVQCGPRGCPPRHQYGGRYYYRRGGGIYFGIGGGREVIPQQPQYPEQPPYQPDRSPRQPQKPEGDDLWIGGPDFAPEIKKPEPKKEDKKDKKEEPKQEKTTSPEVKKKAETKEGDNFLVELVKKITGGNSWLDEVLLGIVAALGGGFTLPALLSKFGMRPLFAKLIGGVIRRRVLRRFDDGEEEVEEEEIDFTPPVKKKYRQR